MKYKKIEEKSFLDKAYNTLKKGALALTLTAAGAMNANAATEGNIHYNLEKALQTNPKYTMQVSDDGTVSVEGTSRYDATKILASQFTNVKVGEHDRVFGPKNNPTSLTVVGKAKRVGDSWELDYTPKVGGEQPPRQPEPTGLDSRLNYQPQGDLTSADDKLLTLTNAETRSLAAYCATTKSAWSGDRTYVITPLFAALSTDTDVTAEINPVLREYNGTPSLDRRLFRVQFKNPGEGTKKKVIRIDDENLRLRLLKSAKERGRQNLFGKLRSLPEYKALLSDYDSALLRARSAEERNRAQEDLMKRLREQLKSKGKVRAGEQLGIYDLTNRLELEGRLGPTGSAADAGSEEYVQPKLPNARSLGSSKGTTGVAPIIPEVAPVVPGDPKLGYHAFAKQFKKENPTLRGRDYFLGLSEAWRTYSTPKKPVVKPARAEGAAVQSVGTARTDLNELTAKLRKRLARIKAGEAPDLELTVGTPGTTSVGANGNTTSYAKGSFEWLVQDYNSHATIIPEHQRTGPQDSGLRLTQRIDTAGVTTCALSGTKKFEADLLQRNYEGLQKIVTKWNAWYNLETSDGKKFKDQARIAEENKDVVAKMEKFAGYCKDGISDAEAVEMIRFFRQTQHTANERSKGIGLRRKLIKAGLLFIPGPGPDGAAGAASGVTGGISGGFPTF